MRVNEFTLGYSTWEGQGTWYLGSCSFTYCEAPPEELKEEMLLLLLVLLVLLPPPWQHLAVILIGTSSVFWVRRDRQGECG